MNKEFIKWYASDQGVSEQEAAAEMNKMGKFELLEFHFSFCDKIMKQKYAPVEEISFINEFAEILKQSIGEYAEESFVSIEDCLKWKELSPGLKHQTLIVDNMSSLHLLNIGRRYGKKIKELNLNLLALQIVRQY